MLMSTNNVIYKTSYILFNIYLFIYIDKTPYICNYTISTNYFNIVLNTLFDFKKGVE